MSNDPKPKSSSAGEDANPRSSIVDESVNSVSETKALNAESQTQGNSTEDSAPPPTTAGVSDRRDLLQKARAFLVSPHIQGQDLASKRAFLKGKGLNDDEVESLVQSLPQPRPSVPPRSYPQPAPSNLPVLLLGIARLFTWLAGGSVVLLLLYRRFLLPRIAQTWIARHSLKTHQLSLLRQLTTSLSSLKEAQSESYSVLPHQDPFTEPKKYAHCKKVAEIIELAGDGHKEPDYARLPVISLLRCAIKETKEKSTTEEIFGHLERHISWLQTEDGTQFEQQLWDTLSTCPLFEKAQISSSSSTSSDASSTQWEYIPPKPILSPPLLKSLDSLSSELPRDTKPRKNPYQHTLQTLSDFTGYLSTQVYMPYRSSTSGHGIMDNGETSIEEELRKEIRALKGLVLNRRSFMPSIPRPGVTPVRTP